MSGNSSLLSPNVLLEWVELLLLEAPYATDVIDALLKSRRELLHSQSLR